MADDAHASSARSACEGALDMFVFAPIGAFLHGPEAVDDLATKGRQDVANARFLGRAALDRGLGDSRSQVEDVIQVAVRRGIDLAAAVARAAGVPLDTEPARAESDDSPPAEPPSAEEAAAEPAESHLRVVADSPSDDSASDDAAAGPPEAESLAIPGYDTLAASQVVPRLEDLADEELAAVQDYERAHRGRMTILSRIAQLRAS